MSKEAATTTTVVVVGDARVGKSALIRRITTGEFDEAYTPTGFDKLSASLEVNKREARLVLWDTSGSPAYDSVRSLSYAEADVFLLCFGVSDPVSLYNVKSRWAPEIRRHRPDAPVVLCGCQQDLRADPVVAAHLSKTGRAAATTEQALAICCEVGAVNYVETSAAAARDIHEAFELCALAAAKSGGKVARRKSSTDGFSGGGGSASSSRKNLFFSPAGGANGINNVSFGSADLNLNNKRNSLSASSSLKKSCNVSFSGSESEAAAVAANPVSAVILEQEDDDVFPGYDGSLGSGGVGIVRRGAAGSVGSLQPPPPLSPRLSRPSRQAHRSSVGVLLSPPPPLHTSTVRPDPPPSAQVRPSGLTRRTSFRQDQQAAAAQIKCVPAPVSPPANLQSRHDLKRAAAAGVGGPAVRAPFAGFESPLRSHHHASTTGSQGSTASKASSASSSSASAAASAALDPEVPDTEDPELLSRLNFVSPKTGVFRPASGAAAGDGGGKNNKKKQSCCVM